MLATLLARLRDQKTDELFAYSIVVVDNDHAESGKSTVSSFKKSTAIPVEYYCEAKRNIALARNKAVQAAEGNFLALIDDDEFPDRGWLLALYKACAKYHADGILGPVKPRFEENPPNWVIKGKFFEKGRHHTGDVLKWQDTRTSNVLVAKAVFADDQGLFREEFGRGGEDIDFFQRAIDRNFKFVWCKEAAVFETIPPERCRRRYMLRRALLRGVLGIKYSSFGLADVIRSIIAIPTYTLTLPFAFLIGHHHFMHVLTRHFEHCGKLLGLCGVEIIKEHYVTK